LFCSKHANAIIATDDDAIIATDDDAIIATNDDASLATHDVDASVTTSESDASQEHGSCTRKCAPTEPNEVKEEAG